MLRTLLICALAGLAASASAADKIVDAELLEFLGSLDSDEDGWHDYLEQAPVKVAGKVAVKNSPPVVSGDEKQVKSK